MESQTLRPFRRIGTLSLTMAFLAFGRSALPLGRQVRAATLTILDFRDPVVGNGGYGRWAVAVAAREFGRRPHDDVRRAYASLDASLPTAGIIGLSRAGQVVGASRIVRCDPPVVHLAPHGKEAKATATVRLIA